MEEMAGLSFPRLAWLLLLLHAFLFISLPLLPSLSPKEASSLHLFAQAKPAVLPRNRAAKSRRISGKAIQGPPSLARGPPQAFVPTGLQDVGLSGEPQAVSSEEWEPSPSAVLPPLATSLALRLAYPLDSHDAEDIREMVSTIHWARQAAQSAIRQSAEYGTIASWKAAWMSEAALPVGLSMDAEKPWQLWKCVLADFLDLASFPNLTPANMQVVLRPSLSNHRQVEVKNALYWLKDDVDMMRSREFVIDEEKSLSWIIYLNSASGREKEGMADLADRTMQELAAGEFQKTISAYTESTGGAGFVPESRRIANLNTIVTEHRSLFNRADVDRYIDYISRFLMASKIDAFLSGLQSVVNFDSRAMKAWLGDSSGYLPVHPLRYLIKHVYVRKSGAPKAVDDLVHSALRLAFYQKQMRFYLDVHVRALILKAVSAPHVAIKNKFYEYIHMIQYAVQSYVTYLNDVLVVPQPRNPNAPPLSDARITEELSKKMVIYRSNPYIHILNHIFVEALDAAGDVMRFCNKLGCDISSVLDVVDNISPIAPSASLLAHRSAALTAYANDAHFFSEGNKAEEVLGKKQKDDTVWHVQLRREMATFVRVGQTYRIWFPVQGVWDTVRVEKELQHFLGLASKKEEPATPSTPVERAMVKRRPKKSDRKRAFLPGFSVYVLPGEPGYNKEVEEFPFVDADHAAHFAHCQAVEEGDAFCDAAADLPEQYLEVAKASSEEGETMRPSDEEGEETLPQQALAHQEALVKEEMHKREVAPIKEEECEKVASQQEQEEVASQKEEVKKESKSKSKAERKRAKGKSSKVAIKAGTLPKEELKGESKAEQEEEAKKEQEEEAKEEPKVETPQGEVSTNDLSEEAVAAILEASLLPDEKETLLAPPAEAASSEWRPVRTKRVKQRKQDQERGSESPKSEEASTGIKKTALGKMKKEETSKRGPAVAPLPSLVLVEDMRSAAPMPSPLRFSYARAAQLADTPLSSSQSSEKEDIPPSENILSEGVSDGVPLSFEEALPDTQSSLQLEEEELVEVAQEEAPQMEGAIQMKEEEEALEEEQAFPMQKEAEIDENMQTAAEAPVELEPINVSLPKVSRPLPQRVRSMLRRHSSADRRTIDELALRGPLPQDLQPTRFAVESLHVPENREENGPVIVNGSTLPTVMPHVEEADGAAQLVDRWRHDIPAESVPTPSYYGASSSSASTDSGGHIQVGYSPTAAFQPPYMGPYGAMLPFAGPPPMAPEGPMMAPPGAMLMPPPPPHMYHSGPPTMMSHGAPMMTPMGSHEAHPLYPPFFTPPVPSPYMPDLAANGYFEPPANIVHHTFASGMQMTHDSSTGRYAFYPNDPEPPVPVQQDTFVAPPARKKGLRHAHSYNDQMLNARRSNHGDRNTQNKPPRMQATRRASAI